MKNPNTYLIGVASIAPRSPQRQRSLKLKGLKELVASRPAGRRAWRAARPVAGGDLARAWLGKAAGSMAAGSHLRLNIS